MPGPANGGGATLVDGRSSDESPYLQRVAVDPARNAIHVMFLWRAGAEPAGNRDPSYLRSDDGGTTWRRSDGSAVTLPVTSATAEVVAPTRPGSQALLNQGGLGIDAGGRAHAVFRVQGGGVLHLWSEGPTWRSAAVSGLGRVTGRPAVVGNGRDPLLVLWAQNRSGRRSDLRVARLAAGQTSGSQRLAAMAVDDWEPTFDSTALVEQRRLRVMVPVRVISRSGSAAVTAAIGTWSVPALETASP